jgi:hypothetical protein
MSLDDRSSSGPNDRTPVDVWKLKLGSVKAPRCVICGGQTRWGIQVRGVSLCDRHWTLKNRVRALRRKSSADIAEPKPRELKPKDIWQLKASTAHLLVCAVCGDNTKWGNFARGVRLCDRHWTLRNRLRAYFGLALSTSSRPEDSGEEG